ncbi:tyrosine-type recombinase/integrase [Yoonia sp. SDW83-1]|uniref:tyrosine-type recombinase/integrase n=1 Tax=Yoonia sp. SDW83-1 TaxID=3366945 RepID=UPI00398C7B46
MTSIQNSKQGFEGINAPAAKPIPPRKDHVVRDAILPQLGRRQRGDHATWVVYLPQAGRTRKQTLGTCAALSVLQARALAEELLGRCDEPRGLSGRSPLAGVAQTFMADCAGRWKPSTALAHQHNIDRDILPALGHKPVGDITREDVVTWFNDMPNSKGARNRALSVLSSIFGHAELTGLRPPDSNPCARMRRHETTFKAMYLDAADYALLGAAFSCLAKTYPLEVALLRFCALTGCRRSEATELKWTLIEGNRAALPDAKSGPKSIWLARPARKILSSLPRQGAYVFSDRNAPIAVGRLNRVWEKIRTELKKPKLRIHDLRHSYASVAVGLGYDLLIVGGLLGHADKGSTAGYAYLDTKDVAAATARVGKHLARVAGVKTASKAPKARPSIKPHPLCAAFARSKDTLPVFCARHNLDPASFQRDLQAWRDSHRRALS